jgi:hypothetical protein
MNLPLDTAGGQISPPECRTPAITRYRALNKHAIWWMTLAPERPLKAHLWCPVVQSDAKMQAASRT